MKKAPLLAVASAALLCSCLGPNNMFRGLNSWNSRATDSRWWNELIYVGLWIVPVYELTFIGDVLIFNSLEFWGAENPIGEPKPFETQSKK